MTTLPRFHSAPEFRPGTIEAKRACIETITQPRHRSDPASDAMRTRSQVEKLSDGDFRAMVVAEVRKRGMTNLWRDLL